MPNKDGLLARFCSRIERLKVPTSSMLGLN